MRCRAEGGQGCVVGLPRQHPSARARQLLSPCLRPLRAGWDPRGGGCPWEMTTREKDPQSWGPVSGGFQGHRCPVAGESDQGGTSPKPTHTLQNPPTGVLCPGGGSWGTAAQYYPHMRHFPCPCLSFPTLRSCRWGDAAPYLHLPSASPRHHCRPRGPRPRLLRRGPRCPPPRCGPGQREPALRSLLTLIKILQHGGRKCIFSSSAAAIRLPGNGWLAGGQGLRRAGAHPARGGGRRRAEPIALAGTRLSRSAGSCPSWVSPWCARLSPTISPWPLGARWGAAWGGRARGALRRQGWTRSPLLWGEPGKHL